MKLVREKSFYKLFAVLTLTIASRNVIIFTVNLADSLMLGRYAEEALSGAALVNQIQFMLQLTIMGICEGAQIFISRAWGAKDTETIRKYVNICLKLSLGIGCLFACATALFPAEILSLLSNETSVVEEGVKYLNIIFISYPFFALTTSLITSLNSVETVKIGFYTSASTLLINICLNYCLIYGNLGFPELGSKGAAIATLCSRIIECTAVCVYVRFMDKKIKLRAKHLGKIDVSLFRLYLQKGLPVFISETLWGLAMSIQLAIIGHMGKSAIAANSIANTIFQILTVITYASASASAVIISKTIGENKAERVKPYAKTLQVLYLAIGIFTGLTLFLIKDYIVDFYIISEESRRLALRFATVLSVTVIGTSYQMPCLTGIVRAGGDTSFVLKNDMLFMWGIVLPVSWAAAFYFHLSPLLVFICLKSDQLLKCTVAVVKVNKFNWLKSIER